ncbi:MAG: putative deoxyribonuclease YjjV [Bacteroidetes bacterium ADurb.BinA245]|jgi:TatD DNase family protein|nr:MAG: putative deoxyribonuclease YjjV [Bacteroidetes bacterium ADurb.BinA245]HMW66741.1 TatD family hydrolase [Chitinophagaceae bacterium]HNF38341.1 TatD family hydrolase [Chitinophagaceae bacterium]HNJ25910.1 TatD family hydrolase [Chitinophagaceae bacterium]HNK60826.1 TatD family hydrolase [Chitinophagaceae bacterium]
MNLIDTHAHVYVDEFEADTTEILQRARAAGVSKILMPAIDRATHTVLLALEAKHPDLCVSMMGLHPCSVKENYKEELQAASKLLASREFIAVGEIGLDFYWDKTFVKEQVDAFHQQLDWALQYDIPVSIHSRSAMDECIEIVAQHQQGKLKGVFHCFSGNEVQAKRIIDLGFHLGIGGVVSFKNSGLDKAIANIPIKNMVLETDAPYLAPVPFRGKRNEPAYLKYVVEKLSSIFSLGIDEVANETTANAEKLFGVGQGIKN